MSDRKSLAQRIDQGSFRPDRHAELLAMSPPLPEHAPAVYRVVRGNPLLSLGHGGDQSVPSASSSPAT